MRMDLIAYFNVLILNVLLPEFIVIATKKFIKEIKK